MSDNSNDDYEVDYELINLIREYRREQRPEIVKLLESARGKGILPDDRIDTLIKFYS